jgi:hypothetical protein
MISRTVARLAPLGFAVLLGSSSLGCATRYIPNTDVEDTPENVDVVKFCEQYRRALERKDTPALLALASPRYYEDGGNVDPTDDLDYEGLREWLEGRFQDTKAIRYEIRYRRIDRGGEGGSRVHVVYTYSASYKIPGIKTDEWRHTVAENRLELEPDGKSFKILAGMLPFRHRRGAFPRRSYDTGGSRRADVETEDCVRWQRWCGARHCSSRCAEGL